MPTTPRCSTFVSCIALRRNRPVALRPGLALPLKPASVRFAAIVATAGNGREAPISEVAEQMIRDRQKFPFEFVIALGDDLYGGIAESLISHDGFQCGYCTPGQICSAVGLLAEGHAKTADEIRELMSGNVCRCGCYPNIVAAIEEVIHGAPAEVAP